MLEPRETGPLDIDLARAMLAERGPSLWYNRIEVIPDLFTAPSAVAFDGAAFFTFMGVEPNSLAGLRVLDIGTFDGAMAFYAEDCGADVVAIDIQNPATNGFALVHEIRGSGVTHVMCSIYELHPELYGLLTWWCAQECTTIFATRYSHSKESTQY